MALRVGLLLLAMLASAWVAECIPSDISTGTWSMGADMLPQTCNGLLGECIDEEEEMMMDSEINRRGLAYRGRWISYGALTRNRVPCNRRGASYYNCGRSGRVNPYRRGCSVITRCKRFVG